MNFTCVNVQCDARSTCATCMWCDEHCPCVSAHFTDYTEYNAAMLRKAGPRKKKKKMGRKPKMEEELW